MSNTDGIITKNVVGLFSKPSIDSEQVTQAIMGQKVRVEKGKDGWLFVETWDAYHGWIQSRWVRGRKPEIPNPKSKISKIVVVASLFTDAYESPSPNPFEIKTKLVVTSELELLEADHRLARIKTLDGREAWGVKVIEPRSSLIHVRLPDGDEAWVLSACVRILDSIERELPIGPTGEELLQTARRFMGVPYLWGGTSPFGIDCSGFVQLVCKLNGVNFPRDAEMQAKDPKGIAVMKTGLVEGDLIFFSSKEDKSRINHVGMSCGDGTFIHSTGGIGVTINRLDEEYFQSNCHSALRMV